MQKRIYQTEKNSSYKEQTADAGNDTSGNDVCEKVVRRHINSFLDNNLEGVLSDYTEESVLVTQEATYTGVDELRGFFSSLITHFPKNVSDMKLEKLVVNGGLVYIVWNAKTPSLEVPFATDTFIVKDDKIHFQTFAGQLKFIH